MNFDEAKQTLKESYLEKELEVDEQEKRLVIHYRNSEFYVLEEDIAEYAEIQDLLLLDTLEVTPSECSICGRTYREHMISPLDPIRDRYLRYRDTMFTLGEPSEEDIYVEVGEASTCFVNYFRFDETYFRLCSERMRGLLARRLARNEDDEGRDIRRYMYRPLTIKVHNLSGGSIPVSLKQSSTLIEASLFELSYLKGIPLGLVEEWPQRRPRTRPFTFRETIHGHQLPLPKTRFNSDIIRFYQRGMSTDDPVTQFLSFYQVLEYFFLRVTDEQLYGKLSNRLNDPKFTTTPRNLDRIIQEVLNYKGITDEAKMLKAVLSKFVDENELIEFVQSYEEFLSEKLYTKRRRIFGQDTQVSLTPGHVVGTISKRIKIVRNAVVHSSDRYERGERHVPLTSESEGVIRKEIPLLKFLAERVIIASSET